MLTQRDIIPGAIVQIDPSHPLWLSGARYGEVVRVAKAKRRKPEIVLVKLGRLGRQWVPSDNVMEC